MVTFVQSVISGDIHPSDMDEAIDDAIDSWHSGDSDLPLHDYLGMSNEQFHLWVRNADILPEIIEECRSDL